MCMLVSIIQILQRSYKNIVLWDFNNINIVFSDSMGKDLGLLLCKNLGENVINHCDSGSNCQNRKI
jgi:hypothetical protein